MLKRLLPAVLLLGLLAGCSTVTHVQVQSNTCWDGFVSGARVNGCGNTSYQITGHFSCVQLQKQTVPGYLRVRVGSGVWVETSAALGTVEACK